MNFNVVPPLAFTSALSITVSLYNHADIQTYGEKALNIDKTIENIHSLPLPDIIKNEILGFLQPVAQEIALWLKKFNSLFYHRVVTNYLNLYQKFSWTPLGTIDYKRTAENYILSGSLTEIQVFALACTCGNVDHIYRLWPIVKSRIYEEFLAQNGVHYNSPMKLWVRFFNNQLIGYKSIMGKKDVKIMFRNAVDTNIVGTAEFFIQKLNPHLKKETISRLVVGKYKSLDSYNVNMFIFLMSQLDEKCVREILSYISIDILIYFLEYWPLQQFFIPMTELLWDVFPFTFLYKYLDILYENICHSLQPGIYKDICKTLWLKIPANVQATVLDDLILKYYLDFLFRPYTTEYAISQLFKEHEDALNKFRSKLLSNVSAVVLNILLCENLHDVVKDIFQQQFAKEVITDDFDRLYAMYTRVYIVEYSNKKYVWYSQ